LSAIEEAVKKIEECIELNEPFKSFSPDIGGDLTLMRKYVAELKTNPTKELLNKIIAEFQRIEKQYEPFRPMAPEAVEAITSAKESLKKALSEA
jgi:Ca2+-binding EF-hand superfamily protein